MINNNKNKTIVKEIFLNYCSSLQVGTVEKDDCPISVTEKC
jgi:hypothetical protein